MIKIFGDGGNSAVASQPCPSGHITADIRLRFAPPKFGKAELRISAKH